MDKITIERETLERLVRWIGGSRAIIETDLFNDLRAALAAQPAEPVAWIPVSDRLPTERQEYVNDLLVRNKYGNVDICSYDGYAKYFETGSSNRLGGWPVIEWLPLAAQPAEPVAWLHIQGNHTEPSLWRLDADEITRGWTEVPLYAAPPVPAAVPLTDERIVELFRETFLAHTDPLGKDNMTIAFARAIERAHGIAAAGDEP